MNLTIQFLIFILTLTSILFLIGQILPTNSLDLQKTSPYECGFDPINSSRLPFSFRFFLVALLFLLFDLEIAILLPLPLSALLINPNSTMLTFVIFIIILTIGLIYEWVNGGLEWANN
uniref:NADH-ubiquinone oxidoreductase chain 3 n=1 Tax=Ophiura albida TaxID=72672 RepID=B2FDM6_OPHAL|nr:NADH dehydrogenase subunit 3 [Ophiura albida]CAL50581.1 NADH dehydrogenase subunit 3 [Ophiura albida]